MAGVGSGDVDLNAGTIQFHGQELAAGVDHRGFDAFARVGLDQQHHAPTAARAANLSCERAFAAGAFDDAVDCLGGDRRKVAFAEAPLFAHQTAGIGPVGFFEGAAQLLRNFRNARQIVVNLCVPVDVLLENVPVVDGGFPRFAGVTKNETALELREIDAELGPAFATRRQLDGGGATEGRGIVILGAGGNTDHDGFGVTTDVNPVGFALPSRGET